MKSSRSATKSRPKPPSIFCLDRLLDPNYDRKAKAVWIFLLVLLMSVCIYEVVECLRNYFYGSIRVQVFVEKRESFHLPSLTICPYRPFDEGNIIKEARQEFAKKYNFFSIEEVTMSDLLKNPDINVTTLWDMHGFEKDNIMVTTNCSIVKSQDVECLQSYEIKQVRSLGGTCVSVILDDFTPIGEASFISVTINLPKAWVMEKCCRVIVHDKDDDPVYFGPNMGISCFRGFTVNIRLEMKELIRVRDSKTTPCADSKAVKHCRRKYLDDILYRSIKCRLPFMNDSLPWCTTPKSLNQSISALVTALRENNSSCPVKCHEIGFHVFFQSVFNPAQKALKAYFQIATSTVVITKEYHWYTLSLLLSNIGGWVGFLFGFSALTLVELLEFAYRYCKSY